MEVGCRFGAQAARRGRWLVDIFGTRHSGRCSGLIAGGSKRLKINTVVPEVFSGYHKMLSRPHGEGPVIEDGHIVLISVSLRAVLSFIYNVRLWLPIRPECLESDSSVEVQAHACVSVLESHGRLPNPPVEHYDIACTQDFQFPVPASHFGTQ